MKIYAILDHPGYNKTMGPVFEEWQKQGHEIKVDMYFDEEKVEWCDVIFGEYIQGGVVHALKKKNLNKPIYVRGIDIDLYFGHYLGVDLAKAEALMFINDYMREWAVENYKRTGKKLPEVIETVHLGVDMSKWTFSERSTQRSKRVGWINAVWSGKGINLLAELIYELNKVDPEYTWDVVGQVKEPWVGKYFDEFIKKNNLQDKVNRIDRVKSVDKWADGISHIVSTSMKECMSLPIAECMAKGIKPVVNAWWGADNLYPAKHVFNSVREAVEMITNNDYNSSEYRQFIEDNYSIKKQVNLLNKIMGL